MKGIVRTARWPRLEVDECRRAAGSGVASSSWYANAISAFAWSDLLVRWGGGVQFGAVGVARSSRTACASSISRPAW